MMDRLVERCMDFAAREAGPGWMQPSGSESILEKYDGVEYVVFRNSDMTCHSVYRVDNCEEGEEKFSLVDPEDFPEVLRKEFEEAGRLGDGIDGEGDDPDLE
ncbi:hypothetical protein FACS189493_1520 [Spirochaetia bacterium]|nr:hypothetical protein FACS189493_1520 [Spirochaetia bacterium]